MMRNTTYHNYLIRFAVKCALVGATFIGGWSLLNNSAWIAIGLFCVSGYLAHRSYKQFNKFTNHSDCQNRAVTLLTKQLTSEE